MNRIINTLLISLIIISVSCTSSKKKDNSVAVATQDTVVYQPEMLYGINIDSLNVVHKKVKKHQFLGTILDEQGISSKQVFRLAKEYKDVFDVRKIRVGGKYTLFQTKDSIPKLAYFSYEKSLSELVIYDFTKKDVEASTWLKEITVKEKQTSGIINSSLWNTIVDNGANPLLTMELSDIFAWSVDFFGIAKGDRYKVIYEEEFVDSTSMGIKSIKYALFKHKGQTYYAIPFEQDSILGYYDEEGGSLKRAFLKAPLKYSRISSKFSNSRYHPVLKRYRAHHGVDYAAPSGTPVHTIGDGTIIKRGYQKNGGGNYIKIKHNSVYTTIYMHLKGFAKGMTVGSRVQQGQTIAYVGSTGLSTGPHLDFRITKNGTFLNPLKIKSPPVKPIFEKNKAAFELKKDEAIKALSAIKYKEQKTEEVNVE